MSENLPQSFDHSTVIARVISLARTGETDQFGYKFARYRSHVEGVTWVQAHLIDTFMARCGVLIEYDNLTDYNICWRDDKIWSLTHDDTRYKNYPDRELPFSGGVLRKDYVARHISGAVQKAAGKLTGAALAVNPADLDLAALYQPILQINPADRIPVLRQTPPK